MNRRKNAQTRSSVASKQDLAPGPGIPADRFRTNVFTWNGPGVENIFIDFEPEMTHRGLQDNGEANSHGEVSERSRGTA